MLRVNTFLLTMFEIALFHITCPFQTRFMPAWLYSLCGFTTLVAYVASVPEREQKLDEAGGGGARKGIKIEGVRASVPSLAPPPRPSSIFLLSLQFVRGQNAEKALCTGTLATQATALANRETVAVKFCRSDLPNTFSNHGR